MIETLEHEAEFPEVHSHTGMADIYFTFNGFADMDCLVTMRDELGMAKRHPLMMTRLAAGRKIPWIGSRAIQFTIRVILFLQ